jgi:heat shock protein HtpX
MNLDSVLSQIFQPYFYFSAVFLIISFVCIRLLSKYCLPKGNQIRSIAYLLPLAIPIVVMLVFVPSISLQVPSNNLSGVAILQNDATTAFQSAYALKSEYGIVFVDSISITGLLCVAGIVVGVFFALAMVLFNCSIAKRTLHILELEPDEYSWLQTSISELSKRFQVATPKIGLLDDLRPNAFTIGYGNRATIVYSTGLLKILDKAEVSAVTAHELSHIKNHDFFYKTLCSALTALSFFNAFAFLASSAAQREREMFADSKAIKFMNKPAVLGTAIAKIFLALQALPKESILVRATTNLFATSSISRRPQILSTHPRVGERLQNISAPLYQCRFTNRRIVGTVLLSLVVIFSCVAASCATVNVQAEFIHSYPVYIQDIGHFFTNSPVQLSEGGAAVKGNNQTFQFSTVPQT